MPLALACASHSPLMKDGYCPNDLRDAVTKGFAELAATVRAFQPDLVIQFSPDHFNGFFYELMPTFCVGVAAESLGDWGTEAGCLDVPQEEAASLARSLIEAEFDIATSYRMKVDHGFVQIWENLFGTAKGLKLIPVFINAAAPPLPSFHRARLLGEAVGRYALATGKRILIAASGGLSHDPPTPALKTATPEVRERLIIPQAPTPEAHAARHARVLAASAAVLAGDPAILPVSEDWDRAFLSSLAAGRWDAYDNLSTNDLVTIAGRGGPEVLCWVAAFAAAAMAGPLTMKTHFYAPIQGWIAGMAIVSAATTTANEDRQ